MWEPECTSSVFLITFYWLTPRKAGRLAGWPAPFSGTVFFQSRKVTSCKTSFSKWFCANWNTLRSCCVDWQIFLDVSEDGIGLYLTDQTVQEERLLGYEDDSLAPSKRHIFNIRMIRWSLKPYSMPLHFYLHTQPMFLQHMLILPCCLRMDLSSNF